MDLAHIVQADDAGQVAGAFHNNPIVEHFDLDVGSFDAVVAVRGGVYDNFLPNEFWECGCCDKFSFLSWYNKVVTPNRK